MFSCYKSILNIQIPGVTMKDVSKDQQQTVRLFRSHSKCSEDELKKILKFIVGVILNRRDVKVATKEDRLLDLISDAVEDSDQNYISENAVAIKPFIPKPKSHVKHHATLVKKFPFSVTMDLASSFNINIQIFNVTMKDVSKDQQQTVRLFRAHSKCSEDELEKIHKLIVGMILNGRDVIVVTKEDRLLDLISDAVEDSDQNYISENAVEIISFVPKPESHIKHHATLVKKFPFSVAMDLASSSEFTYGNLWFLIPFNDSNIDQYCNDLIDDIRKLSTFIINELPVLKNEAVALPAMYDGHEILWFIPNNV